MDGGWHCAGLEDSRCVCVGGGSCALRRALEREGGYVSALCAGQCRAVQCSAGKMHVRAWGAHSFTCAHAPHTHTRTHTRAGYEIGVASTKAYTSQILCLTMAALHLAEDSVAKRPRRDAIADDLLRLPDLVSQ